MILEEQFPQTLAADLGRKSIIVVISCLSLAAHGTLHPQTSESSMKWGLISYALSDHGITG